MQPHNIPKRVLWVADCKLLVRKRVFFVFLHYKEILGNMINVIDNMFFISSPAAVGAEEYHAMAAKMDVVDAFARITNQGIFVADLLRDNFMYVSDSPLVLFGRDAKEVMQGGYTLLREQTVPEDRPLMAELINSIRVDRPWMQENGSSIYTISCNFHFFVNGHSVLINHKVTPLALTNEGEVWLVLCLVSPSVHSDTGHIEATVSSPDELSVYSFENHRWRKRQSRLVLTEDERTMLHLSAQGYTMRQIGEKMFRSMDTVKKYRRQVFDKLGVSNISEAIAYAFSYNLLKG